MADSATREALGLGLVAAAKKKPGKQHAMSLTPKGSSRCDGTPAALSVHLTQTGILQNQTLEPLAREGETPDTCGERHHGDE